MKIIVILFLGLLLALTGRVEAMDVGERAQVSWKGTWYPSRVLDVSGNRVFIHYDGYESSWDEWVTMDRVKIEVLWKGQWYKARALRSDDGYDVLIHYDGYDSSWDEWVTMDRIRAAR
ncbi:MAG: RNA-binding protein [Magnetococcales bacterium]|nr:RNA-binding protein [Magnetococcales bacterium]